MKTFREISQTAIALGPQSLAAAGAADPDLLASLARARDMGLITPTVVGDQAQIETTARQAGLNLAGITIAHEPIPSQVSPKAVALVRSGSCKILMKGNVTTGDFMKAVLDKDKGLRGTGLISHVFVTESSMFDRLFLITDGGVNIRPSLAEKAQIIRNALPLAQALIARPPNVAVLAAIEKPNPKMPETQDAAELVKMNQTGQLAGCTIAGPLALDAIIRADAAQKKKINTPVSGNADIILTPDLVCGNSLCKAILYFTGNAAGGYVCGASAPVIFLSRADDVATRLNSITLGVLMAAKQF